MRKITWNKRADDNFYKMLLFIKKDSPKNSIMVGNAVIGQLKFIDNTH